MPSAMPGLARGVVFLLAVVVFINYVDRGALATAAPLIKDQLRLDPRQLGLLLSAFFWVYTPGLLFAGWLAERIGAYRTLALGVTVWALATAASGLATGFTGLILLRLMLGLGESAAFPCSSKLFAAHLPSERLGLANGLVAAGLALGPAFGTFAGGLLMAKVGWRPVFVVFGLGTLAWLVPWWLVTRRASAAARAPTTERLRPPPWRVMLAQPALWGAGVGHFCANYAFYFVISWLPLYLVKARGLSISQMAEVGGLIYVAHACTGMAVGWACDVWMRRGASATRARMTALVISQVGAAAAMAGCALGDRTTSVACLFLAAISFGFNTPTLFAVGQTIAGPRAAGQWIGVQNAIGNLSGIVAPLVTGLIVERTGSYGWAFASAGAISLAGVFFWTVMVRRIAPLDWAASGGGGVPRRGEARAAPASTSV